MSVRYSVNHDKTTVHEAYQNQRKLSLQLIISSLARRFFLSDLTLQLSHNRFEFTPLQEGYIYVYYDALAKSRKGPLAATICLRIYNDEE